MPYYSPNSDSSVLKEIERRCGEFYADPLGFVMWAYPWGEPGPLEKYPEGPDVWQMEFLRQLGEQVERRNFDGTHPVEPIREAISSGHGTGKGVLSAFIACWIMSTRPYSQGTVTANTFKQLDTKTWATITHWFKLCITGHWFELGSTKISSKEHPESWFVQAQTCDAKNSEAFQGQHAATSTSWYLFDEASAIPFQIWDAAEGGLTDGEPMIFAWGQPTRNSGRFHEAVFGKQRHRWSTRVLDSRTCRHPNKQTIQEWIDSYGENSDFVRVRVRGLAPNADDLQFIDAERVVGAQQRQVFPLADDPLVCGVDVARGGGAFNIIRFRRGLDARSIPPVKIAGQNTKDTMLLVAKLAQILTDPREDRRPAMMFVDSGYGGPAVDRLHQLNHRNVHEVNFGGGSPDLHQANYRAFMWQKMKDWLPRGAIDSDPRLEVDLTAPGSFLNGKDQLVLESKKDMEARGVASPDDGDALALTFAEDVAPLLAPVEVMERRYPAQSGSWMR